MNRIILVLVVLVAILLSSSLYTVKETQVALKLRLGEIVSIESEPGLTLCGLINVFKLWIRRQNHF